MEEQRIKNNEDVPEEKEEGGGTQLTIYQVLLISYSN